MNPKISVIIPVFNGEKYISQTINSVLTQTYENIELIIVNDGSNDDTEIIIKTFRDSRIKYMLQANNGVSAARNTGIGGAEGEFIAFLDADDVWLPEKLEKQLHCFANDERTSLVFSDSYFIDAYGNRIDGRYFQKVRPHRGAVYALLLRENFIPWPTVMIRRNILSQTGLFNSSYSTGADYDFTLRIARIFGVDYVDEPLLEYRLHSSNMSRDLGLAWRETIAVREKNKDNLLNKQQIVEIEGTLAKLLFALGREYQTQRRWTESKRVFSRAIRYSPNAFKAYAGYLLSILHIAVPRGKK